MADIGSIVKSADWKQEKHVPVIEAPASVKADTPFAVTVSVGKEIAHPNTTEHHISWIQLYFMPEGGKFAYQVGNYEFQAHGASTDGPNTGPVSTDPILTTTMKLKVPGTLTALSFCNIHGLWQGSSSIAVS